MTHQRDEYLARQVAQVLYLDVVQRLDETVAVRVSDLLAHVRAVHRQVDVDLRIAGVEVLIPLDPTEQPDFGEQLLDLRDLAARPPGEQTGISVYVAPGNRYRLVVGTPSQEPLDGYAKYFVQEGVAEVVAVAGEVLKVEPVEAGTSPFAVTYFRKLERALDEYGVLKARSTQCALLSPVWGDGNQLVLSNRPEHHMRRSLHDYLCTRLRDADPDVLQEQNVNESKPVDIRVQWRNSSRMSLIEVKWIGDSITGSGPPGTTSYRDARAREGLTQVRAYVLEQRLTSPRHLVRGRLVVFDARREGLSYVADGEYASTDPWAFRDTAIIYHDAEFPDDDLDEPLRYFMEPTATSS